MKTAAYSLQRRLLTVVLGASSLLWLSSVAVMIDVAWDETGDLFDDGLKETAHLIVATIGDPRAAATLVEIVPADAKSRVRMHYQIIVDGRVIRRTAGAPQQPFVTAGSDDDGYADSGPWRVYVLHNPVAGFDIQVAQQDESRLEILEDLAEDLLLPALALLLLLALVSWFAIWYLLRPLQHTARVIARKSPNDLTPLATDREPSELLPVISALNSLLARLNAALIGERRFTADAAHELRTPLAALRTQVQLMQRQQSGEGASLQKLRDDIDRITALVAQSLVLARLDHDEPGQRVRTQVRLAPLLAEVCETARAAAAAKAMTLECRCHAEQIDGDTELLCIALRNLIDNAIRYCPPGSRVQVTAHKMPSTMELVVSDNGPGVPFDERARLADRFYRVLGSGVPGSGLGLSIVKRIADRHEATLIFADGLDGAGLTVRLSFPRASFSV
ncbi:MAG: Sensor protein QseC [Chromatiales bacterium USCg_Taylor]|nr:MAG: Sensor protein QseC [Chromatiales bacterium USCg_Taylor]